MCISSKKNRQVLLVCKETSRGHNCNQWTLGTANNVTVEQLWTWVRVESREYEGDPISRVDWYEDPKKDFWIDMVKIMWRKHRSIFQYHVK